MKAKKTVVGLKKYRINAAKETNDCSRPVDLADLSVCEEEDFPLCSGGSPRVSHGQGTGEEMSRCCLKGQFLFLFAVRYSFNS